MKKKNIPSFLVNEKIEDQDINKDDLFKAIHYIVLLISSEHFLDYGTKEESDIDTMLNLENEMTRGK